MEANEFAEILRGLLKGRSDFTVFADSEAHPSYEDNLFTVRVKQGELLSTFNIVIEEV